MKKLEHPEVFRDLVEPDHCAELVQAVRDYFDAEALASSPPCLSRYRGAVRKREVARRNRLRDEARAKVEKLTNWTFADYVKRT